MIARMPELSLSDTSDEAEAEQAVDFVLVEHALGAALGVACENLRVLDRRADHCADGLLDAAGPAPPAVGAAASAVAASGSSASPHSAAIASCSIWSLGWLMIALHRHWTTISLNSTALMRLGAIATLTRRVSSSFSR